MKTMRLEDCVNTVETTQVAGDGGASLTGRVTESLYKKGVPDFIKSQINAFYTPRKIDMLRSAAEKISVGAPAFLDDDYIAIPSNIEDGVLWYAGDKPVTSEDIKGYGASIRGENVIVVNNSLINKHVIRLDERLSKLGFPKAGEAENKILVDDTILSVLVHEYTHLRIEEMKEEDSRILYDSVQASPRYDEFKERFLAKNPSGYKDYSEDELTNELVTRIFEGAFVRNYDMISLTVNNDSNELFGEMYDAFFAEKEQKR